MTITLQRKVVTETPIEIQFPSFFMCGNQYFGFINEHTVIRFCNTQKIISIDNGTFEYMESLVTGWNNWVSISEGQFLGEYEAALECLSLNPKIVYKTWVEDLESIGVKAKEVSHE